MCDGIFFSHICLYSNGSADGWPIKKLLKSSEISAPDSGFLCRDGVKSNCNLLYSLEPSDGEGRFQQFQ